MNMRTTHLFLLSRDVFPFIFTLLFHTPGSCSGCHPDVTDCVLSERLPTLATRGCSLRGCISVTGPTAALSLVCVPTVNVLERKSYFCF